MFFKKLSFIWIGLISSLSVFSQSNSVISGIITNGENSEPLPYASITLVNHPIGTISNEEGEFDFYIPKSKRTDTLSISFIGFNPYLVPLRNISGPLEIKLRPADNILDEVILTQLSALDYIKKALENLDKNYPQDPYQSLAFYREKFIENDVIIKKEEAVFKTYYPTKIDSTENQHQLVLYKPAKNPQKFQFMREWIEKMEDKEKKKAIKNGEEIEEDEYNGDIKLNMGGPDTVLDLDINQSKDNFLDPKYFKKYEYTLGEETSLNGEQLVTINFKAKKTIDHIKDHGKILISKETYAIILIEAKGKAKVPVAVRPILFIVGLSITNPTFTKTISYQKFEDKWYPSLFRWDANVKLKKRHMFKSNEHSAINIGQVFLTNRIDSVANSIPESKQFESNEDMSDQVYNDMDLKWEGLNIIKD